MLLKAMIQIILQLFITLFHLILEGKENTLQNHESKKYNKNINDKKN